MPDFPSGSDLRAARLLCGYTAKRLAELAHIAVATLDDLETGARQAHEATAVAVMRILKGRGVRWVEPGKVELDGFPAPTFERVNRITGSRLKDARFRVRLTTFDLAVLSGVSPLQIRKLERLDDCREGVDQTHLYAVMGALHRSGYRFGQTAHLDDLVHPRCKRCVQLHPADQACAPATA